MFAFSLPATAVTIKRLAGHCGVVDGGMADVGCVYVGNLHNNAATTGGSYSNQFQLAIESIEIESHGVLRTLDNGRVLDLDGGHFEDWGCLKSERLDCGRSSGKMRWMRMKSPRGWSIRPYL